MDLPSTKEYLPGTKKTVNGQTYMVVGNYSNYGKILKSTKHWTKLTKSNRKYLDTNNTVAKLLKSKKKSKRRSVKKVSKKKSKRH